MLLITANLKAMRKVVHWVWNIMTIPIGIAMNTPMVGLNLLGAPQA